MEKADPRRSGCLVRAGMGGLAGSGGGWKSGVRLC